MTEEYLKIIEEAAFYESGLSAHGCLEKLDSYTIESIERYGRYLLNRLEEDLREADLEYIKLVKRLTKVEEENETIKQRLKDIKEGFEGCCYACEPVGMLNQKLEEQLRAIEEDGTEEHNNAVELRMKLAETLVKNDELKKIARKLYGTVLHVYELAKVDPLVVIGPSLYKEAAEGAKEYEDFE
jgi:chromosome segregation ATPase